MTITPEDIRISQAAQDVAQALDEALQKKRALEEL